MTRAELDAIWTRYAHRSDIEPDLDEVYRDASQRILERLLRSDTDLADILLNSPSLYKHAGLMTIHELAQDDESMAREAQLFELAATQYAMQNSLQNVTAESVRPYYAP